MKYIKTFEKFSLFDKLFGDESTSDTQELSDNDIKFGDRGDNVVELQKDLETLGFKLWVHGIDGIFGSETHGQCKALFNFIENNRKLRRYVDDDSLLKINNKTITIEQQDLIDELSSSNDVKNEIKKHYDKIENNVSKNKNLLKYISEPENFIQKLNEISKKLQVNPNWLLAVMWKESKINPSAQNSISKATGLIQWMPSTLRDKRYKGITTDELKKMSATEQLDLVYLYFKPYVGKLNSLQDVYAVTFFPAAMGKDDDWVLQSKNVSAEKIAAQNKVVDLNRDGKITKGEFDEYVVKNLPTSLKPSTKKSDV